MDRTTTTANLKQGILADFDSENGDGVFGMARHGGLLVPGHPPTRRYRGEHRRSIPLRELGSALVGASGGPDQCQAVHS